MQRHTCSAVIACICISMPLGTPPWQLNIPPPLTYRLNDARTFVGLSFFFLSKRYIFCIFFENKISALFACIRICLPLFNPHWQFDTPRAPPPLQFNWCWNVCWFFPYFPYQNDRFWGEWLKNNLSCNCLYMHFYAFGHPPLTPQWGTADWN